MNNILTYKSFQEMIEQFDASDEVQVEARAQYIIDNYDFDLIVSAAYGQIVPMELIEYPKYKAINVHGSLLPKGRGGAPIQRAIMNGEKETGITIMYMAKKMDAGDILLQEKMAILDEDTKETLFIKLANLGAKMINHCIFDLVNNNIKPIKQNDEEVTYTYALTKDDEHLDFSKNAYLVKAQIRGLGEIGASFTLDNINFKVYPNSVNNYLDNKSNHQIGEIINVTKDYFTIQCESSEICFKTLKPEGKNLMSFKDYYNGKGKDIFKVGKIIR